MRTFEDYLDNEYTNSPNPRETWHMNAARQMLNYLAKKIDKLEKFEERVNKSIDLDWSEKSK